MQEKIEVIKSRLMNQFGYNEQSAKDALDWVANLQSKGDAEEF
jgi:serine protein kinase